MSRSELIRAVAARSALSTELVEVVLGAIEGVGRPSSGRRTPEVDGSSQPRRHRPTCACRPPSADRGDHDHREGASGAHSGG